MQCAMCYVQMVQTVQMCKERHGCKGCKVVREWEMMEMGDDRQWSGIRCIRCKWQSGM